MKKLLNNKFANYLVTLFVWACTHVLIYRSTVYLGQDFEASTTIMLWCVAIYFHLKLFITSFREMAYIYVGKYDASNYL